jgi:transposase
VIRRKEPERRLFYGAEELYRPPRTNFYIRLNETVGNWGDLCSPLLSCFSQEKNGRPSDPVVYFKIFLVAYFEGITFDTDLADRIADSLAIREFIGYGPSEQTPDHSSISRVRAQFACAGSVDKIHDDVVSRCSAAGLVDGSVVAADSVLLRANAGLSSLVSTKTGLTVREHLQHCRESGEKPKVSNEEFQPSGDEDARIARKRGTPVGMYYKATHVTDSKSQVILSVGLSKADVGECEAAKVPLKQAKTRLSTSSLALGTVLADAGYDDGKFHRWVEDLGATPLTNYQEVESPKPAGYAKADFTYDAQGDHYVCPAGKILTRGRTEGDRTIYVAEEHDCLNCPFRKLCLDKKKRRRIIKRPSDESARGRNIARCHTDQGREQLKLRKTIVEPPFGHMKRHGGLDLINCWTQARAEVKVIVAAIAWNLLKLIPVLAKTPAKGLLRSSKGLLQSIFAHISGTWAPKAAIASP